MIYKELYEKKMLGLGFFINHSQTYNERETKRDIIVAKEVTGSDRARRQL